MVYLSRRRTSLQWPSYETKRDNLCALRNFSPECVSGLKSLARLQWSIYREPFLRVSRFITGGLPFDLQPAEDEIATIRRQLMQQRVNHAQAGEPQRSVIMRLGALKGPPHGV